MNRFMIFDIRSANAIDFADTRVAAEAQAAHIRGLNPDMPPDDIVVVEFDEQGMAV